MARLRTGTLMPAAIRQRTIAARCLQRAEALSEARLPGVKPVALFCRHGHHFPGTRSILFTCPARGHIPYPPRERQPPAAVANL